MFRTSCVPVLLVPLLLLAGPAQSITVEEAVKAAYRVATQRLCVATDPPSVQYSGNCSNDDPPPGEGARLLLCETIGGVQPLPPETRVCESPWDLCREEAFAQVCAIDIPIPWVRIGEDGTPIIVCPSVDNRLPQCTIYVTP